MPRTPPPLLFHFALATVQEIQEQKFSWEELGICYSVKEEKFCREKEENTGDFADEGLWLLDEMVEIYMRKGRPSQDWWSYCQCRMTKQNLWNLRLFAVTEYEFSLLNSLFFLNNSILKNPKRAEKLERKLMYRAEYINFLENLKILEISEDHTYADVKALHTEITRDKGSVRQRIINIILYSCDILS